MQKKQGKWVLDLDTIFDFIIGDEGKNVDTNIEEVLQPNEDGELKIMTKVVKDSKNTDHSAHETMRYDFLRHMLDDMIEVGYDKELNMPMIENTFDELSYNTLIQYGFIKKV